MSAHSVRVGEKFLSSLRVINQLLTAKTFLRFSIAASASRCIYCSRYLSCARRYSAEYFSPCAPHRSLREPLLQLRCHHLALATQLARAQKALFLRFTFSFTSLIPCLLPPREEREKTERTTAQLPANKKCCLLIFAIAIVCFVLADFPATKSPPFFVHYPEYYSGHPCVPATCCVFASDLAKFSPLFFRYRWLLCSRGSAREISSPLNLKL